MPIIGQLTAKITLLDEVIPALLEHPDGYHGIRALPGIGPGAGGGDRGRDRRYRSSAPTAVKPE